MAWVSRERDEPVADKIIANSTPRIMMARTRQARRALTAVAVAVIAASPAQAERIENNVAIFSALDKVTARISKFEAKLGETKVFGGLKVTPRACYSRPPTEQPKTTTFVEVDEVQLDGKEKRIFTGWMFAESPGLYGVEHPTFDVWLTECQSPKNAVAQKAPEAAGAKPKTPAVRDDAAAPGGAPGADDVAGGADAGDAPAETPSNVPAEPRRRVRR
jgi:hypothetical protein